MIEASPGSRSQSKKASSDVSPCKIPWKRVAGYIAGHGGYQFGNATCRRKWDEVTEAENRRSLKGPEDQQRSIRSEQGEADE